MLQCVGNMSGASANPILFTLNKLRYTQHALLALLLLFNMPCFVMQISPRRC
jgi:hypothetical protein